jgi:nucleoid DNA-binding protein
MNNRSELNSNFQNRGTAIDTLDIMIVNALLEGRSVVVPDFGYLELKLLPDNRQTVLFKAVKPEELPPAVYLDDEETEDYSLSLSSSISLPLKEGKVVSLPSLGIFRPLRREDGNFYVAFTPSSILRKWLSENKKIAKNTQTKKIAPVVREAKPVTPEPDLNIIEPLNDERPRIEEIAKTIDLPVTKEVISPDLPVETLGIDDFFPGKKKNILRYSLISACVVIVALVAWSLFHENKDSAKFVGLQSGSRNLVDVARKNYGNPAFWVYIYERNQDKLTSPVNIPENVVLTIPDLSEYNIDITDTLEVVRARIRSENILQNYIEKKK